MGLERTGEFVDNLSVILPIKLDLKKQLFIHAARNNVNGLTDLMVTHNFNDKLLLQLNQKNQSILTAVCAINCQKTFHYLTKIIPNDLLRERLIFPDQSRSYPLKRAIEHNHFNGVLENIFKNDEFNLINYKDQRQVTP